MSLDCGGRLLVLDRPRVMGVLNVTPDSFSDGGQFTGLARARDHGCQMAEEGADLIDVGGESTRPGAVPVSLQEEVDRVVPVVEALVGAVDLPISVDTSKPEVARAAVAAGAGMVNDVCALEAPGAVEAAADLGVPICLMHMQGEPRTMQLNPHYDDVVAEVCAYLAARVAAAEAAGLPRQRLLIDPGFGFGKRFEDNYRLLRRLDVIVALGLPVLVGMSRKSMIGQAIGERSPQQRRAGSVAAATLAAFCGAAIVRCHDVAATADALRVVAATKRAC